MSETRGTRTRTPIGYEVVGEIVVSFQTKSPAQTYYFLAIGTFINNNPSVCKSNLERHI